MARLIRCIVVDDVDQEFENRDKNLWIEFRQIKDEIDAQNLLQHSRGEPSEVLLLDVDMSKTFDDYQLQWGVSEENQPFCGPILALPFLSSRETGATHSAQPGFVQSRENLVRLSTLRTHSCISVFGAFVRITFPRARLNRWQVFWKRLCAIN